MLSPKLVQMIERHADGLAEAVARELLSDRRAPTMANLAKSELRDQCREFLKRLGHWLVESEAAEIARHYEDLGRLRLREGIPLHEAVHALHLLKKKMLDDVRAQGFADSAVDVYGEEELEHAIGGFFDSAVYHVVHGYETSRSEHAT